MKKKYILSLLLLLSCCVLNAQDFELVSVESLLADMSAREEVKTYHDDRQCALLRVATQNIVPNQREGFSFVPDLGSEVVQRATRDGEIWLWVSPGLKYLRIKHRDWGQYELRLQDYVTKVESLHTYKITIKGTLPLSAQEQSASSPTQQYLVFQLSPTNAMLEVDGQLWEVGPDGSAMRYVNFGTYSYRVQAPNYLPETGKVTVDNPNDAHTVSVKLRSDFVEVTLKVDADAEIWVNNEKKGIRTWTGALGKGTYKVECKQEGHETTMVSKEITSEMKGQTLTLPAPKPIFGSLNVESTPIGATIMIDGKEMGKTPKSFNELPVGRHELRLVKDSYDDFAKTIDITRGVREQVKAVLHGNGDLSPVVKPEPTAVKPLGSIFFVMANGAYSMAPQTSFGLTVGSSMRVGWYASLSSNFMFGEARYECDGAGVIADLSEAYSYTGEKRSSRMGVTAGMVFRLFDPLYAYVGGGYGVRNKYWQLDDGSWARCTDDSYRGVAMDAGLMLHFGGFGISLGVQTIGVDYLEAKIGMGYTLKRKKP